jgi:hypothetical protein
MGRIAKARLVCGLAAAVLLIAAHTCVGVMKGLVNLEAPPGHWMQLDVPPEVEQYEWSGWQRGAGSVAPPPRDDLRDATVEAHRFARRQTLFKDYLFCEARYLLKDGAMRVAYASCPAPHVTLRSKNAAKLAWLIGAAGTALLLLCIFWPGSGKMPENDAVTG